MNNIIKKIALFIVKNIKSKPYLYVFWGILFFLCIPIAIWVVYFLGDNGIIYIKTSLTVGDALGFYGIMLSFFGSIVIGIATIYLATTTIKISQSEYRKNLPYLQIVEVLLDINIFKKEYHTRIVELNSFQMYDEEENLVHLKLTSGDYRHKSYYSVSIDKKYLDISKYGQIDLWITLKNYSKSYGLNCESKADNKVMQTFEDFSPEEEFTVPIFQNELGSKNTITYWTVDNFYCEQEIKVEIGQHNDLLYINVNRLTNHQ